MDAPDPVEPIALRRGRREKKKSGASSALEKIRRGRETGVREETEVEEPEKLFEYVTEDEYSRIVQQRQEEGFIMDDDGSYCEHGREIFDEEVVEDEGAKGKGGPAVRKPGVKRKVAKPASNIKAMVMGMGGAVKKRREEGGASIADDPLLADMLQQMKEQPSKISRGSQRSHDWPHSSPAVTTPQRKAPKFTPRSSSTPHPSPRHPPTKRVKIIKQEKPASPPPSFADDPWDGDMGDMGAGEWESGDVGGRGWESEESTKALQSVKREGEGVMSDIGDHGEGMEESTANKPAVPEAAVSTSGWETVRGDLPSTQETLSHIEVDSSLPTQCIDGEEVLPFYWLDAYENWFHQPGTVYLFGKVWVASASTHVSCCVAVKNIPRCLHFLPREKMLSSSGKETDTPVTFEALYQEFNSRYAEPYRIMKFTSRRVTRRYAFELPDVPQESEYLQVQYSAEYQAPPHDASGKTFSRVFGSTSSSLEHLIISRQLKGPCWLHITQPKCPPQPVSWCKMECVVGGMECVLVAKEQAPPPPLITMCLSMKIILNPKTGTNEVLCVGALVHSSVSLDKPPPKKPFEADFCTIRRPLERSFPFGFEEHLKRKRFNVEVTPTERAMLAYLLAKIHRIDPDIIVGHNLTSFQLDVLQHRLTVCKVPQWSRISRLKRKDMPKGRTSSSLLCAGRPVCDVRTSAKELVRARSYDLPELARFILHTPHQSMEHEEMVQCFNHSEQLASLVAHTMNEAMISLQLMYELNVLPLAYQITSVAGNTLSRTLLGGRAERNEFLLLHAFSAKDYICPDKLHTSKKQQHHAEAEEEEGAPPAGKGRRKPAYTGGLVLEPKKGFYDTFILLLDFNSLYPSIIQEYNICFTTVDHAHCSQDSDDYSQLKLPDPSLAPGILPSEIRVLVERRRQVKQLMKGCQGNAEQYMQYDIRQKALKLTANSMYGCLGFSHSRFHAKPLAALITGKGREILMHTKELAEKLGLDVIYGDTDSVMINSHTHSLPEAQQMAQKFKAEVNKLYRLLEIDVDGIFQCMLLLKKKKYAAKTVEVRDGHMVYGTELKGLDIVRRDWCELAKKAGHHALDLILSGRALDEVIEEIQSYLQQLRQDVEAEKIPLDDYIITKSLTKSPDDYPDKKSLPHVQVALRMRSRGKHVQAGDVIPYVMCQGEGSQLASLCAYHPEELSAQPHLSLDTRYYLRHQLHAVVSRLCEPIAGLHAAQIAECLGLDPSGYRSTGTTGQDEEWEGGSSKEDKFAGCHLPSVVCPACHVLVAIHDTTVARGFSCSECTKPIPVAVVMNSVTLSVKAYLRQYYAGWLVCEDKSCQFRSRTVSAALDGVLPPCPQCHHGRMKEEFPASALYHQLAYYHQVLSANKDAEAQQLLAQAGWLDWNAYSRVDLARVFPAL